MSNNDTLGYDNRVIVVTGAGNGIGKAHALTFARRGGSVIVNDINREAADSVVADFLASHWRTTGTTSTQIPLLQYQPVK